MCGEESFILSQIDYNGWIRDHGDLYALHLDNTDMTVRQAAEAVAAFARERVAELSRDGSLP
jgi:hypothetical protein